MSAKASQITAVSIVCPTGCSGVDQRKHQRSASLAFVRENFLFDATIMAKLSPDTMLTMKVDMYFHTFSGYQRLLIKLYTSSHTTSCVEMFECIQFQQCENLCAWNDQRWSITYHTLNSILQSQFSGAICIYALSLKYLTHRGRLMHMCFIKLGHYWFR